MADDDDEPLSPQMAQHVAEVLVRTLRTVNAEPPDGCAILALAYAMWVEAEPEATPELLRDMLLTSNKTSREAFRILRVMRGNREELLNATSIFPQA